MRSPVPIFSFLALILVALVLALIAPTESARAQSPPPVHVAPLVTVFANAHGWAKRGHADNADQARAIMEAEGLNAACVFDEGPAIETGRGTVLCCQATQVPETGPAFDLFDSPMRGMLVMRAPDPGYYAAFVWLANGEAWLMHYDSIGLAVFLHRSS